jgi:uncharacterized repeat protein (TIGR02543 family)
VAKPQQPKDLHPGTGDLNVTYLISYYDANGVPLDNATLSPPYPVSYQIVSSDVILPLPVRVGYTFLGWREGSPSGSAAAAVAQGSTGDKEFYAEWTPTPYTITYEMGIAPSIPTATYTIESADIPLAPPVSAGYAFDGWYDDADFSGSAVTQIDAGGTGDRTFHAKWNPGVTIDVTLLDPVDPVLTESSIYKGETAVFSVAGTYTSYQWYMDGIAISGETSDTYTLDTYTLSRTESVEIHEVMAHVTDNGADLSTRVRLTIKDGPWIIKVPTSRHSTLQEALAWIDSDVAANGGETYIIKLAQDEDSLAPNTLSYNGNTVSITLVGVITERTVTLSSKGSLFTVQDKVTLPLVDNITLKGVSSNTAALVRVESGGKLEMKDGSKISGNTVSSLYGSGVSVDGGTFNMSGGKISDNKLAFYGGGVFVKSGTFTKSGGTIYGDTDTTHNAGDIENTAANDEGHAAYVSSGGKKRNTTAAAIPNSRIIGGLARNGE